MACRKFPIDPIPPPPPPPPPPPGPDPGPDPGPTPGPTGFFYAASYYGAVGCTSDARWQGDLDRLKSLRISNVRVWYDWPIQWAPNSRFILRDGRVEAGLLGRFRRFLTDAAARGFRVDITSTGPGNEHYDSKEAWFTGITNMATALKDITLFYPVDVFNEFTAGIYKVGATIADGVRATTIAKTICPTWSVTCSMDGDVGTIGYNYKQLIAGGAKIDLFAPHYKRDEGWGGKVYQRTTQLRADMAAVGISKPIYVQEESWSGESVWSVEQSTAAGGGAKSSGAAGYCFHTTAGFDLSSRSYFEQLTSEELTAMQQLP